MRDRLGSEFVAAGDLIGIQVQLPPNDLELLLSMLRSHNILAICTILLLFSPQPSSNQLVLLLSVEAILTNKSGSSFETNCIFARENVYLRVRSAILGWRNSVL